VAVASVGYVILYARDVEASAAFYRHVAELPFKLRDAGYAEFVTGKPRFRLLERTRASALIRREPTEGGPAGEVLFLVDDVDAEAERLRGLGVEFLSGPVDRPWGHRTPPPPRSRRVRDRAGPEDPPALASPWLTPTIGP
jgi:lactoylglutathione lyase